jgi:hypothetical protein
MTRTEMVWPSTGRHQEDRKELEKIKKERVWEEEIGGRCGLYEIEMMLTN